MLRFTRTPYTGINMSVKIYCVSLTKKSALLTSSYLNSAKPSSPGSSRWAFIGSGRVWANFRGCYISRIFLRKIGLSHLSPVFITALWDRLKRSTMQSLPSIESESRAEIPRHYYFKLSLKCILYWYYMTQYSESSFRYALCFWSVWQDKDLKFNFKSASGNRRSYIFVF